MIPRNQLIMNVNAVPLNLLMLWMGLCLSAVSIFVGGGVYVMRVILY